MQFTVTVAHDEENGIWYVVSSDIPGLHVEAPSLHLLVDVVDEVAPDLIAANLVACSLEGDGHVANVLALTGETLAVVSLPRIGGVAETRHLLSSAANARHIDRAIDELDAGKASDEPARADRE
jgi:uncharacterized protein DUF1902